MIDVRRATPEDAEELIRLRALMLRNITGRVPTDDAWERSGIAQLRDRLGTEAGTLAAFVVDKPDTDGIAACVVGQIDQRLPGPEDPTGRRGYVYNVATDPAYRRRGFSRACMESLLEWFAGRGIGAIDLRASAAGEPLYASLGFVRNRDPSMRLIR